MRTDVQLNVPAGELARRGRTHGGRRRDGEEFERFKEAAQEFESVLVEQMVKEMRTGDFKSTLYGKDSGMETYRDMLDGEYVRLMSQRGGIGLADFMIRNTPPELMGKTGSGKDLKAAKAAGTELNRTSSFAGTSRHSTQTGLPAPGAWGANKRPGE
jgi:Rod binding domain-containing protein